MTNKNFYKEMKDLASYVQDSENFPKPASWHIIKNYENKQNGFRATAFKNDSGKKVLVYAGTDLNKEILKDFLEDVKMSQKIIPNQANDAFNAYENFKNNFLNRYSSNSITIVGYSLGGSLAQIICNETGAEGVTFEAYGVGDLVNAKHTEQIVNFGNENDPIFLKNIDNHLGTINVILKNNSRDSVYSENKFSIENINHLNLSNHNLENIGDIDNAKKYKNYIYKLNANYEQYNDSIFTPSNRIFYENEVKYDKNTDNETAKASLYQYMNEGKLPKKEELDRRTRFGELIYVNEYVRSDGVKVSGYYRRYPN